MNCKTRYLFRRGENDYLAVANPTTPRKPLPAVGTPDYERPSPREWRPTTWDETRLLLAAGNTKYQNRALPLRRCSLSLSSGSIIDENEFGLCCLPAKTHPEYGVPAFLVIDPRAPTGYSVCTFDTSGNLVALHPTVGVRYPIIPVRHVCICLDNTRSEHPRRLSAYRGCVFPRDFARDGILKTSQGNFVISSAARSEAGVKRLVDEQLAYLGVFY